jgi:hypothetical protein
MCQSTQVTFSILEILRIASAKTVGDILSTTKNPEIKRNWTSGQSATVQAQKRLNRLVIKGKLDKGWGFYKLRSCKSKYTPHTKMLSGCGGVILKTPWKVTFCREKFVPGLGKERDLKGRRPDAMVSLTANNLHAIFILECVLNERESSILAKRQDWASWPHAKEYLSELFQIPVEHYAFIAVKSVQEFEHQMEVICSQLLKKTSKS